MQRIEPIAIGDALRGLIQELRMEDKIIEQQIINAFKKAIGIFETYCREVFYNHGVLYVNIASAVVRQELNMNKQSLLATILKELPDAKLQNIVFR